MSDRLPDNQDNPPVATQKEEINPSRRKLGLSLGASAVFTLASRPVLAATACATGSEHASGNLSSPGTHWVCSGHNPLYWTSTYASNNEANGFPGGNVNFHIQFTPPVLNGIFKKGAKANWGNSRLRGVMLAPDNGNTGTNPNPISKEFAATLLNIRNGDIPAEVLSESRLIMMWNDWVDTGFYEPKALASWNADEIVEYLRTLQG